MRGREPLSWVMEVLQRLKAAVSPVTDYDNPAPPCADRLSEVWRSPIKQEEISQSVSQPGIGAQLSRYKNNALCRVEDEQVRRTPFGDLVTHDGPRVAFVL